MSHLDGYKLPSDRQHTFRKRHRCETQLTTVINDWAKVMDISGHVDTFILDLGKSCSFGFPRVLFVNCRQFMYLVISLLVLRAGCGI